MMDSADLWTRRRERDVAGIEDAIELAIVDAKRLETDAHLNGRRQDVAALRNQLSEALRTAGELRESFGEKRPEPESTVDTDKLAEVVAERENGSKAVEHV